MFAFLAKAHRSRIRISYTNYCNTLKKNRMILVFEPNVTNLLCDTLQHNRIHHLNTTAFFMFVSSAVKWIQVSFCRLGKTGAAIWLPHNLDVWINIQLDKRNVGLELRSLLLAACRQFNPPAVHFTLHRHNKLCLDPPSSLTGTCM